MPSCSTCGAFTDEKGRWAPADHLSQVVTERDKAVKESVELRWAIGGMTAQLSSAQEHRKEELEQMFERVKLLNYRIDQAVGMLIAGNAEAALKCLRGESVL